MFIIVHPGFRKTNALLNLIKQQDDDSHGVIDKIHLYAKDSNNTKYNYHIKRRRSRGCKQLEDPKVLIEYSNNMQDVYKNIEEYNPERKHKELTVFDGLIPDLISNKKPNQKITELFIR